MLRIILVASLLVVSACAVSVEYLKVDSEENPDGILVPNESLLMSGKLAPGVCGICQKVIKTMKKKLGDKETVGKIKEKLKRICDKIPLWKDVCKKIVIQNLDFLAEELSTKDDPKTVCITAGFCRSVNVLM